MSWYYRWIHRPGTALLGEISMMLLGHSVANWYCPSCWRPGGGKTMPHFNIIAGSTICETCLTKYRLRWLLKDQCANCPRDYRHYRGK